MKPLFYVGAGTAAVVLGAVLLHAKLILLGLALLFLAVIRATSQPRPRLTKAEYMRQRRAA